LGDVAMKKIVVFLLVLVITLGVFPSNCSISVTDKSTPEPKTLQISSDNIISASNTLEFKDVPKDAWYYEHVQFVANHPREIMVGYNGIFNPLENLTVEQFVKIVVHAAGEEVIPRAGEYWANVYIQKGLDLGYVEASEFSNFRRAITREEMARIIIRALPQITGEKSPYYNINDIKKLMPDFNEIGMEFRDYVCQAYKLGILVGGSDGKFNPKGNLSRASAAVVVNMMLNPDKRAVVKEEDADDERDVLELWSDAEFEQYISENVKNLAKIEDKRFYFTSIFFKTPTALSDKYNPGVNDLIYNCAKIMAYHAQKNGHKINFGYHETNSDTGYVFLDYIIFDKPGGIVDQSDISITFYEKPVINYTAEKYAPGEAKRNSFYKWHIGVLRDKDYLEKQGFVFGMDRSKFKWTQDKYEKILSRLITEVYGPTQGRALFNLIMEETHKQILDTNETDFKYIGFLPGANVDVAYLTKAAIVNDLDFYTSKPEVRR